jgi:hypothetical protein
MDCCLDDTAGGLRDVLDQGFAIGANAVKMLQAAPQRAGL